MQTNTYNVNKTSALQQTTGGKDINLPLLYTICTCNIIQLNETYL